MQGAIHVHSTYSDGEFTLGELRTMFLSAGCRFLCISDHAESFTRRRLMNYTNECSALSDDRFCFIAGLEFECREKMHILGYGVTSLADSIEPQEIIRHIQVNGGLAVIAHPKNSHFAWIETFKTLPMGIEVWNTKYDGRYAPRPGTFHLLRRLQERQPQMRAFYGQDFHYRKQFYGLLTHVRSSVLRADDLLRSLASGDYVSQRGDLVLPSTGVLPGGLLEHFDRIHRRYDSVRVSLRRMKKIAQRMGFTVPSTVITGARRFFF